MSGARWGSGFSAVGRFVGEVEAAATGKGQLRPGYVLSGDEVFLLDRCRAAVLKHFVPADLRDFCLSDLDLAQTSIFEVLDRAQTPSLMAPFQVIFIRNVRQLYTRGAKKEEFAALDRYFKSPNPQAVLLFIADFVRIPSDARRMDMEDKNRYERLTETLGEHCGMVELARVSEEDAMRWVAATAQQADSRFEPEAARELVDALGADMMLVSSVSSTGVTPQWWASIGLHTAGYLITSAIVALFVFYKAGLAVLRRAWLNLDQIWIVSLIAMGALTLVF